MFFFHSWLFISKIIVFFLEINKRENFIGYVGSNTVGEYFEKMYHIQSDLHFFHVKFLIELLDMVSIA